VFSAATVEEGFQMFCTHKGHVDLLLSDIVLEAGNGVELADRIRKEVPELPVILCSGFSQDALKGRSLEEQRYELLTKPYSRRTLLSMIQTCLNQAKVETPSV